MGFRMSFALAALFAAQAVHGEVSVERGEDGRLALRRDGRAFAFVDAPAADVALGWAVENDFVALTVAPAASATNAVVREVRAPAIRLAEALDRPVTLGSGGLRPLGEDPGSYGFLAVAEPVSRRGVVLGFLTAERGSGVLFSRAEAGRAAVEPVVQYGRLALDAGESVPGETLLVGAFDDCRLGLEAYADSAARAHAVRLPPQPAGYCTWYSDRFGKAGTADSTAEFAKCAAEKLVPWGMSFFQIDDQWQSGVVTNWLRRDFRSVRADGPYPEGLRRTSDGLRAHGLRTGLWFLPFCGSRLDPAFADRQDLFVRSRLTTRRPPEKGGGVDWTCNVADNDAGAPYESFWGGTVIDYTNPVSEEYLADLVRRFRDEWGVSYLKFDALFASLAIRHMYPSDGYAPDDLGEQVFRDPKATNVSNARRGLKALRKAAGPGVFLLACNLSQSVRAMVPAFGVADAMRVGPDNSPEWDGVKAGPIRGTSRYFLNGRVWYNDPDPVYVRDSIPASRARVSATWASLSGDLFAFSDWLPDLSPERVEILRRTIAPHGRAKDVRPVDLFESALANAWLLKDGERAVLGVFNWDDAAKRAFDYAAGYAGLDPEKTYAAFDFWKDRFAGPFRGRVALEVPAGDVTLLHLREFDGTRPVLVSTSRHAASPVFEVASESWDAATLTLRGVSSVVPGERYELRLVVPKGWRIASAELNGRSGLFETDGPGVRVSFRAKDVDAVRADWSIAFARAEDRPLTLATPFTDHAVLQRDRPVRVSGRAWPGAAVRVSFANAVAEGIADGDGRWTVVLPPMPASGEPRDLTVSARSDGHPASTRVLHDVLVGEVWFASGQSNMQMPLFGSRKRFRDKMGALTMQWCATDRLRLLMTYPVRGVAARPRSDYPTGWAVPTRDYLATNEYSAIAYYFGRELATALDVPVGIMGAWWGGSEIAPWVPDCGWEGVKDDPHVATNILVRAEERPLFAPDGGKRNWPMWPGDAWNEMVAPLAPYAMRGMIWYQGESNMDENNQGKIRYATQLRALLDGWRREFGVPDLKFITTQLAQFTYPWLEGMTPDDERLAKLCDEQRRFAEEEPDAWCTCIADVGDLNDIHPQRKLEVALRMAGLAFEHVYGMDVKADPPQAASARLVASGKVEISLKNAEGLFRWSPEVSPWTENQHEVSPFRFVDAAGRIVDCESEIEGEKVIVTSTDMAEPRFVTYLRRRSDVGNIYNGSAVPLGTFKLEVLK